MTQDKGIAIHAAGSGTEGLDPGIRDLVLALQAEEWETTDSGDGVSKPADERAFDCRHVVTRSTVTGMVPDAHRLQDWLDGHSYGSFVVEASYAPRDGVALLIATER